MARSPVRRGRVANARAMANIRAAIEDALQLMTDKTDRAVDRASATQARASRAGRSAPGEIDRFLGAARQLAPLATGQAGRLVFALDATMSRQPTWDLACSLQAQDVRGRRRHRRAGGAARLFPRPDGMPRLGLGRRAAAPERADEQDRLRGRPDPDPPRAQACPRRGRRRCRSAPSCFVGDAMEEDVDALAALAGELGLRGIRGFLFQEGHDPAASAAFAMMARLTGGAHARFDVSAPGLACSICCAAPRPMPAAGARRCCGSRARARRCRGCSTAMDGGRR